METRRSFFRGMAAAAAAVGLGNKVVAQQAPAAGTTPAGGAQAGRRGGGNGAPRRPMTHNGLIYIGGIGAHPGPEPDGANIKAHTKKVLDVIKSTVEAGGGTMESILQLNVYLATLLDYEAMNDVYKTYFPSGGPARMTVAVAGIPGQSLIEINGIAAVVNPPAAS